ncbi:MAG: phage tail sheath subtilisin-like domain-containing protein [Alphaproteobacteria bacterium]
MSISFNEIPNNLRVPFCYMEFDASKAQQGSSQMPYKILVIGQRLSSGSIPALTPTRVTAKSKAALYFGKGSMLSHMLESLIENNDFTETYAVALDDDAAGVAATGSITVAGTASASGTIYLYVAGRRVKVAVSATQTAEEVAANIVSAINAITTLPLTAAVDGTTAEKVNLIARHKGLCGNEVDLRDNYYSGEELPAGLTLTYVSMNGGTSNPDVATVFAAIGDTQYNIIAMPYTDSSNLAELKDELTDRWGPLTMNDGMAFAAANGTHSELGTLGDSHNHQNLSIMSAAGSPTPAYEWAAVVAGVTAYYSNIDPARPLQTLALSEILAPLENDRFTSQENNLLLYDGISTTYVNSDGKVCIQRLITTYKENSAGADDTAYLDVATVLTLSYLRYDYRNYLMRKYPRHKLASDGTRYGAGQAIVTPKTIKAETIAWFKQMETKGLVEGIDQFKTDLIVERNADDANRLDIYLPPDLVNQMRVFAVQAGFRV